MELDFVVARLKSAASGFKTLGSAADAQAAHARLIAVPAAFVVPLSDSAQPLDLLGRYGEQEVRELGVLLVLSNLRDTTGAAALASLAPMRAQVRQALAGWVPDASNGEPMHFVGGNLLTLDDNARMWWLDRYRLKTFYYPPTP